jgi:hypothetical protein
MAEWFLGWMSILFGYRVIYYMETADKHILVTLYSKSDQSDIPAEEVVRIISKYESQL